MFKKLLGLVSGLVFFWVAVAQAGSMEDWFTKTYVTPNIKNFTTDARDTAAIKGKLAFDSTLNALIVDDGSVWLRVLQGNTKLELTQTTAPTVSSCTGGSVRTGSTDMNGEVTGITGTSCTLLFNTYYANVPFGVAGRSSLVGSNNALRYKFFKTGLEIYNMGGSASGEAFSYLVLGYY